MMPRMMLKQNLQDKIEQNLYQFSCEGLRTLVFASKVLAEDQYLEFKIKYDALKVSIENDKDEKLN